jgi:xylulokinase
VLGTGRVPCRDLRRTAHGSEHDPSAWLDESFGAVREAIAHAGCAQVDAIGVGALGPAPVLLDADLSPLAPASLFPIEPTSAWVERLPVQTIASAAWLVDVAGFIVSALVGWPVMDRITAADHEGLIDLPDAREPFDIAGTVTASAAERLGLHAGAPVTIGTYDTFVDLAAVGAAEPGSAAILLGSTVIVGVVSDETAAPEGLRTSPHAGPGRFIGGWTSTAGRALEWAAGLAGYPERTRAGAASTLPGDGGVLALPYLDGERAPVWDPRARGALLGLTTTTTVADIYRAMLDGVVLSTVDLAERLAPVRDSAPWVVAGGGVRDDTWLQATVDALGEPVIAIDLPDAGAAARAAFTAIGSPLAAPVGRVVEPDLSAHARWVELAAIYRDLYPALADPMHRLTALAPHGDPA